MKKLLIAVMMCVGAAVNMMAADITEVWEKLMTVPAFITAQVPAEKAAANGFESLDVALNSAPTSDDIETVRNIVATINDNEKLTAFNNGGIEIAIYAAPASADMKTYRVLYLIDRDGGDENTLIVLCGICTADEMMSGISKLSIEDIIGG